MKGDRKCDVCGNYINYLGLAVDYPYKARIQDRNLYFCGYNCQRKSEEIRARLEINTDITTKARETYGDTNQIAVCIEELSELIKVLTKYFRYEDEETALKKLRDDALDETTDVYIILEHVKGIFHLRNGEINKRAQAKLARVERWLNTSKDFSYTMEDRKV